MTFIVTAFCMEPTRKPRVELGSPIRLRPVMSDQHAWARAGYPPGVARFVGEPFRGVGYHILTDDGKGHETSNAFFSLPSPSVGSDEEPARFRVPVKYRGTLAALLTDMLAASGDGRIVLVVEDNGHVTAPELTPEEADTIDVIGPIDLEEFWRLHDLGEIVEDSVITIRGNLSP